jgi:acyl-CoA synthetase (AMP-forming)/AMP-acid ligase II
MSQETVETISETPNIATRMTAMARRQDAGSSVLAPIRRESSGQLIYDQMSDQALDEESDLIAMGLRAIGIAQGTRAVLMVPPGLDFFTLVFGVLKAAVVPVLIDPGIGLRHLRRCCHEAAPEVFIGIPKAILAGRLLGWGRPTVRRWIGVAPGRWRSRLTGAIPLDFVRQEGSKLKESGRGAGLIAERVPKGAAAAILFTSGSTGPPKGAIYTHGILNAQADIIRDLFDIQPREVDVCTFPLFALFAPVLGMTSIVPYMDPGRPARADPACLAQALVSMGGGATNLFGSPALLHQLVRGDDVIRNKLVQLRQMPSEDVYRLAPTFFEDFANRLVPGDDGGPVKLATLKRVVSAGAPVPASLIESMAARLVPPAQVHTVYGATEALPVASIGSDEILGETRQATDRGLGVCVGRPVPGIEVQIIQITDEPVPEWSDDLLVPDGMIGEIAVAGPVVTREYFNRPDATRLAKIGDAARSVLYHRMGDVGYLDDRGRIWFCGRKSHRVVLPDETLFTIPCEAIFNTHPDVFRSALVGVRRGGETLPVTCVEPVRRLSRGQQERVRRELLERGAGFPHTRRIRAILFHPAFPVDIRHNSKIFREKLAVWAGRRLR